MEDLLYTLALTKRLGKQGNIARAPDVKLYFRLFIVKVWKSLRQCKVVNVVRNNQWWASAALGHETLSNWPPHRLRTFERFGLLLPTNTVDTVVRETSANKTTWTTK